MELDRVDQISDSDGLDFGSTGLLDRYPYRSNTPSRSDSTIRISSPTSTAPSISSSNTNFDNHLVTRYHHSRRPTTVNDYECDSFSSIRSSELNSQSSSSCWSSTTSVSPSPSTPPSSPSPSLTLTGSLESPSGSIDASRYKLSSSPQSYLTQRKLQSKFHRFLPPPPPTPPPTCPLPPIPTEYDGSFSSDDGQLGCLSASTLSSCCSSEPDQGVDIDDDDYDPFYVDPVRIVPRCNSIQGLYRTLPLSPSLVICPLSPRSTNDLQLNPEGGDEDLETIDFSLTPSTIFSPTERCHLLTRKPERDSIPKELINTLKSFQPTRSEPILIPQSISVANQPFIDWTKRVVPSRGLTAKNLRKSLLLNTEERCFSERFSFGPPRRINERLFNLSQSKLSQETSKPLVWIDISPEVSSKTISPGSSLHMRLTLPHSYQTVSVRLVGELRMVSDRRSRAHTFLEYNIDLKTKLEQLDDGDGHRVFRRGEVEFEIPRYINCSCNSSDSVEIPSSKRDNEVSISFKLIVKATTITAQSKMTILNTSKKLLNFHQSKNNKSHEDLTLRLGLNVKGDDDDYLLAKFKRLKKCVCLAKP
ncbi:hypothetical protein BY996DRAFT_6993898 [Phakopsora pachyrhizi]|nr:hypothetical protein BY996DRAFT_6993898 [Phakopsora pachyrhizi]